MWVVKAAGRILGRYGLLDTAAGSGPGRDFEGEMRTLEGEGDTVPEAVLGAAEDGAARGSLRPPWHPEAKTATREIAMKSRAGKLTPRSYCRPTIALRAIV